MSGLEMRLRRLVGRLYGPALVTQVVLGFFVVVVGGIQRANLQSFQDRGGLWQDLGVILGGLQSQSWWLLPLLLILTGTIGLYRKIAGPPWVWDTIKHYLDIFRDDVFDIGPQDATHHHRVTLFKYVWWRWGWVKWPWSGWLIPVERSGHTTQDNITCFRAPDAADSAEGVAGLTWSRRNAIVEISNLPDLGASPTTANFETYARHTGVTVQWLRQKRPKARSFYGIPVEVKGKLWGVIVLDSRSPAGVNQNAGKSYKSFTRFLARLIERV